MSGKGDTPRPVSVDAGTFADNWVRTFGRREPCDHLLYSVHYEGVGTALSTVVTCDDCGKVLGERRDLV